MRVNWLVVGVGDITRKRVIAAIQSEPRSVFRGLVTRDLRKAEAYPGVRAWGSVEHALASDPEIDAVYVGRPVVMHAVQTIAALRAGKHVLCEKPVAMNFAEATSVCVANETGRLFGVAYYRRFYPKLVRAKELIAQGAVCELRISHGRLRISGWARRRSRQSRQWIAVRSFQQRTSPMGIDRGTVDSGNAEGRMRAHAALGSRLIRL
jgi:predicted dehydrogenase